MKTQALRPEQASAKSPVVHDFDLVGSIPFFAVHIAALVGGILTGFQWQWLALAVVSYVLRMFFVTAAYHRYFAHRTFKLGRVAQFVFAWMASTTLQKGVLWWAANHREHHRVSDQPEDLHSPIQHGVIWAHVGWILSRNYTRTRMDDIQDFAKFPELVWLNKYHLVPAILYAVALTAIGGLPWLVWGFFISSVALWHGTFTINSLSHIFGTQRYRSNDTSKNNPLLALVTLGEGWHNNHHTYMSSTNQGFFWWEFDITYYGLKILSWLGIARDLRKPPLALLENKRIQR